MNSSPKMIGIVNLPLPPGTLKSVRPGAVKGHAAATAEWRRAALLHGRSSVSKLAVQACENIVLLCTFYPASRGLGKGFYCPQDDDNGVRVMKPARDGLQDAWETNDKRMRTIVRRAGAHHSFPLGRVVVEVWPLEPGLMVASWLLGGKANAH